MEKLEELKQDLKKEKERYLKDLELAKQETLKLISEADYKMIAELETYNCYNSLRRYARKIDKIDAQLRTINYLI